MRRLKQTLIAVGILAASAGGIYWAFRPEPIPVEAGLVTRGLFRASIEEEGRTRIRNRYVISTPLAGRVLRLPVKAGDAVEAGMPIATLLPSHPPLIDPRTRMEFEERIGAAEAAVQVANVLQRRAEAQVEQARSDVQRVRTLERRGVASTQQLEREELSLRIAERDLEATELRKSVAEHELDQARALLRRFDEPDAAERWEITAPVDGRVLRVSQESEAVVASGTPLAEIGDPGDLEVIVDVLTTDAVSIDPGDPVSIERWGGGRNLEGKVRLVEPAAFTKLSALGVEEQRVWVVIDLTSPQEEWSMLGDAYRVEAKIVVDEISGATLVPATAVFRTGDGWSVFAIDDGVARRRRVAVVRRSAEEVAVSEGLSEGEHVVLFPPSSLSDGAAVIAR
jgi:HlyD family secretion protein